MRIIAGEARGRRLSCPRGMGTRPTTDRVREALFSILGAPPPGTRVLDLFAGAGTLGLEALSRGAESAVFVERDRAALQCLRRNVESLGFSDRARVNSSDVRRFLARGPEPYQWIFMDPPYASDHAEHCLGVLGAGRWLSTDALVIVEHEARRELPQSAGALQKSQTRRYGDTSLSMYRRGET